MTKTVQFSLLSLFSLLSCVAFATSAVPTATDSTLWYNQPAALWEEALPLGNGRLGAMVYGKPSHETIELNENTFWAGGPHNNLNAAALSSLPEIRHLIAIGDYAAAEALTTYGIIGIKCWIFKGEILGHDPMAQDRLMMEAQTSGVRPAR